MSVILGFDISSSCIGFCVLELSPNNKIILIHANYIKPPKKGDLIERIALTRDEIKSLIEHYQPDYIAIENIVKFMKNKSSANTIIMLTTFNRMICLLAYDYLKKPPLLFNVMSIRHGLKQSKVLPKKDQMPDLVAQHLGIKFPYEYNRNGKVKPESEDKADAIAVALYTAYILSGKIKKKRGKA